MAAVPAAAWMAFVVLMTAVAAVSLTAAWMASEPGSEAGAGDVLLRWEKKDIFLVRALEDL